MSSKVYIVNRDMYDSYRKVFFDEKQAYAFVARDVECFVEEHESADGEEQRDEVFDVWFFNGAPHHARVLLSSLNKKYGIRLSKTGTYCRGIGVSIKSEQEAIEMYESIPLPIVIENDYGMGGMYV